MHTEVQVQVLHGREFRRCLVELDVAGMQKLWARVAPHLPQTNRDETLYSMHLARVKMRNLPAKLRAYSQAWLDDYAKPRVVPAIGLAVGTTNPARATAALDLRREWEHTVMQAVRDGVDLDKDAMEIKQRCLAARKRLDRWRYGVVIK